MSRRAKFIAWSGGLSLAYFSIVWIYLVVGQPCSYHHHPFELDELCSWAGSPIK